MPKSWSGAQWFRFCQKPTQIWCGVHIWSLLDCIGNKDPRCDSVYSLS